MSGLTDVPFRAVAWSLGAGYLVSEMLSSKPELWDTAKSQRRRERIPGVHPIAVQLAGSDPGELAESAERHVEEGAEIIDLNFGCPAKKVCRKAAGSALLNDEALVSRIVTRVADRVRAPVTVKTRTGWSGENKNGLRIARIVEDAGARALFLHGRTRECRFKGEAEHVTARRIKAAVSIPVIVNGDIDSVEKANAVLEFTGADGLMVGRGAIGAPWLLGAINGLPEPSRESKRLIIVDHVRAMHDFYGPSQGPRVARKHVIAYLAKLGLGAFVPAFNRISESQDQLDWLGALLRDAERPSEGT